MNNREKTCFRCGKPIIIVPGRTQDEMEYTMYDIDGQLHKSTCSYWKRTIANALAFYDFQMEGRDAPH